MKSPDNSSDNENSNTKDPNDEDDMLDSTDTLMILLQLYAMNVNLHVPYINSLEQLDTFQV
eukprot:710383-Ditylum_brightwellii.AAC.1